jgi:hypothetical protein
MKSLNQKVARLSPATPRFAVRNLHIQSNKQQYLSTSPSDYQPELATLKHPLQFCSPGIFGIRF